MMATHAGTPATETSQPGKASRDGARETGPALELHYRFILWLVPTLDRFPRAQRFLLGDRIQGIALDVLESLIDATYAPPPGSRRSPGPTWASRSSGSCSASPTTYATSTGAATSTPPAVSTRPGRKIGAWMKAHRARKST